MSMLDTDDEMDVLQSFLTDPITNAGQTLAYMKSQPMSAMAQPPMPAAVSLLASSSYPQPLPQSPRKHPSEAAQPPLFGGVMLQPSDENDDSATSTDVDHISSKKKSRGLSNASNDDPASENKRQRGRPRVDTRDETAADRRRTQIRLAQRAYRQRKETTISALKKRVQELERNIEQVSASFLSFNDHLLDSGLVTNRRDLTQQLKEITEQFIELSKLASHESDQEYESAPQGDHGKDIGSGRNSISESRNHMETDANHMISKRHSMSAAQGTYPIAMHGITTARVHSQSPRVHQQILPAQTQPPPPPLPPPISQRQRQQEEEMFFSFPSDFSWQNFGGGYRMQYEQPVSQSMSDAMFASMDPTMATQSMSSAGRSTAPP